MSVLDIDHDYSLLSLQELLAARDHYHLHLMRKQHVVGTAVGRYLIRSEEPWPTREHPLSRIEKDERAKPEKEPRTLDKSEIRPYSWPCVLVFVDEWIQLSQVGSGKGAVDPAELVPPVLAMPDGTRVPVCVVYAPTVDRMPLTALPPDRHDGLIGGGSRILIKSQGTEHFASVGCIVTDGHTFYALTNRHVTGPEGTPIYANVRGREKRVGISAAVDLTQQSFTSVYPNWPGTNVFVNLDIGLIEIEDINDWTTLIDGIGPMGPLADVSTDNLSLRLIDCDVTARGGASGILEGKVKALFYRYKTLGGFEYVADCLIGPSQKGQQTMPGDSGTVWMLKERDEQHATKARPSQPLAIEWGAQRFIVDGAHRVSPFTLATFLSTACRELQVDIVRDWNVGSLNYWGAVGHYLIAEKAIEYLPAGRLRDLMMVNLDNISLPTPRITKKVTDALHLNPFIQLADVPDLVWKRPGVPGSRGHDENPNHFANMDRKSDGESDLLDLYADQDAPIKVSDWQKYYNRVRGNRGLLPFRVWQYFDAMLDYLVEHNYDGFIAAAGTLAHYVGDACQPLHISYLYDGDPDRTTQVEDPDRPGRRKTVKHGAGVHEAYEKHMVNYHVGDIAAGIDRRRPPNGVGGGIEDGHGSARAVIDLMRETFGLLDPMTIVNKFAEIHKNVGNHNEAIADELWAAFDDKTRRTFANGCECLARIWLSAWEATGGDAAHLGAPAKAASPDTLRDEYYMKHNFVQSYTLDEIEPHLRRVRRAPAVNAAY